jgi:hypothetical protein
MKISQTLVLVVSYFLLPSYATTSNHGSSPQRQLVADEASFCNEGFQLAWVTFDMRKDWTPILPGEYLKDIGFGFTMSVTPWGAGEEDAAGPRVYDSSSVGGHDPDLELGLGNLLIIQQGDSVEPNDNMHGGVMHFFFDRPTDIYSIQLVDFEESNKIFFVSQGKRTQKKPTRMDDRSYEDMVVLQHQVDKMKIKLFGSGAVGNIKMCIPRCEFSKDREL